MTIMDRNEFLLLPAGRMFTKYEPSILNSNIMIKGKSIKDDFFYQDIIMLDCLNSEQMNELLDNAEKNGTSINLNFNSMERDGTFDDEQLFLVFEKQDVLQLIIHLITCCLPS